MATMWKTIISDRYAAGRLWTPEISLDMMGNHWSQLSCSWDMGVTAQSLANTSGNVWRDWFRIGIGFPEDYALDAEFGGITVNVGVEFNAYRLNTDNSTNMRLEDVTGATAGDTINVTASAYGTMYTLTWTGTLTGHTWFNVQGFFTDNDANTIFAKRDFGAGPTCYIRPVLA